MKEATLTTESSTAVRVIEKKSPAVDQAGIGEPGSSLTMAKRPGT